MSDLLGPRSETDDLRRRSGIELRLLSFLDVSFDSKGETFVSGVTALSLEGIGELGVE